MDYNCIVWIDRTDIVLDGDTILITHYSGGTKRACRTSRANLVRAVAQAMLVLDDMDTRQRNVCQLLGKE